MKVFHSKKQLSPGQKKDILRWKNEGIKQKEIAARLKVAECTICRVLRRNNNNDFSCKRSRSGRKKTLTEGEIKVIQAEVEKNRGISGPKLSEYVKREIKKNISPKTAKRYIKLEGFKAATARRVPFISKINKEKRLSFAQKYILEPIEFWKRIIWTDETKLNLYSSDGKTWVWRRSGEALNENVTTKTIKHNGGGIILWGSVSYGGVGKLVQIEGIMDGLKYVRILQENLGISREKMGLGNDYVLQQDNDPKHKSKIAMENFKKK
jgi:transposase